MSDQQFRRDLICAALARQPYNPNTSVEATAALVVRIADALLAAAGEQRPDGDSDFYKSMVRYREEAMAQIARAEAAEAKVAELQAKLAAAARLAQDSAGAAGDMVGLPWRTDDMGDDGVVLLWDGLSVISAELGPGFYDTSKARSFGNPTHWAPFSPPEEANNG